MIDRKRCVTTLPITPVGRPNLGVVLAPFLADVFSKKLEIDNILALNLNGLKFSNENYEDRVSGYLSALRGLDIVPSCTWKDNEEENIPWINIIFNKLREENYISKELKSIIRCKCGAVESLTEAENISPSRALYASDKNRRYCKLCKTELREFHEFVYLFKPPAALMPREIFPYFYAKEMEAICFKFNHCKFLISRSRPSAFSLAFKDEEIFLDVDFVWQMFLPLLRRRGYKPEILIGGNKNLMACYFSIIMSQIVDQEDVFLVIPPYYLGPRRTSLKDEQYLSENLLSGYDSKSLRLLLATALNWRKKESIVDFELMNFISKMSYRIHSKKKITNSANALVDLDGARIKNLLVQFKKTRDVFYGEELCGLI